jgi:hypothetical protein
MEESQHLKEIHLNTDWIGMSICAACEVLHHLLL